VFPLKQKTTREILGEAGHYVQDTLKLRYLSDRLSLLRAHAAHPDGRVESALDLLSPILNQARSMASARGSKLYFVFLPQRERYSNSIVRDDTRRQVLAIVNQLGIPTIDIHAGFQHYSDPLDLFPFRRMYHYNEKGHQLVADGVLRHISQ